MSDSVDLHVVDDIITRARDATSFAQVHDAYTQVLQANGIRPSSDKSYYQFLLKLGMIRAHTWGERWDVWRQTNGVDLLPPPISPRPHPLRSRVPFLASASSDLDEGFGADSEVEGDIPGRESPRRAIHRSLVGYTPVESDGEVTPPMRTSTPVQAQFSAYRDRARPAPSTPTPPPPLYSESDISQPTLRSPIYGLTPRARIRFNSPKQVPYDIPELEPTVVRQMEAQADNFYRIGLLGRCWGAWYQAAEWIMRTNRRIDDVRVTICLRQALQKWHDAYEYQLALPGTADQHYAARVQTQAISQWLTKLRERRLETKAINIERTKERKALHGAWVGWRARLVKRRTKRWEEDIREREKDLVQRFDARRVAQVFDIWRDRTRGQIADRHVVQTALRRTFATWSGKTVKLRSLDHRMTDWERQHSTALLADALRLWRKKARLGPAEDRVSSHQNRVLVKRVWSQWRVTTTRQSEAKAFDAKRLIKMAMLRMKNSIRKTRLQNRKAMEFADHREDELLRTLLSEWVRQERSKLLERVLDTRRVRASFITWQRKLGHVHELESKVTQFAKESDARALQGALSRWRDVSGQKRNAALKADLWYEAHATTSTFTKWTAASVQAIENGLAADKAHTFFTIRATFKKWNQKCNKAIIKRKQDDMIDRRRVKELKSMMKVWRNATAQSLIDRATIAQFQARQDHGLLKRSLELWTMRVVELKAREFDIEKQREANLVKEMFARWRKARKRTAGLQALMESIIDIKQEKTLRRAMAHWNLRTHREKFQRQQVEAQLEKQEQRLIRDTFEKWYDKRRERELRPLEEEAQLRHEDALMFSIFDKWTGKSRNLVAVQFDQRRVRAAILPRWIDALENKREFKRAAAEHDRKVMVDAFLGWRDAYRTKMAKKPYRSRRRMQGSPAFDSAAPIQSRMARYGSRSPLPEIERDRERPRERAPPRRDDRNATPNYHRPSMPNLTRTPATRPRRSLPPAAAQPSPRKRVGSPDRDAGPTSVASEPAYSRLRSELARDRAEVGGGRDPGSRAVSDEVGRRVGSGGSSRSGVSAGELGRGEAASRSVSGSRSGSPSLGKSGMSELVRALRYGRV